MKPIHFDSAADFRAWLEEHHADIDELWVGFYKKAYRKATGRGGITYLEAVDEALCFGWIDGLKKRVDEASYTHRFTPRRPKSQWSAANVRRVRELKSQGRMAPAGLAAFEARDPDEPAGYSYESRAKELDPALEETFRGDRKAWEFFRRQPPGYRKLAVHWVMSAKREATRRRRLDAIVDASRDGERLPQISGRPAGKRRLR